jgi:hypothetical protein
MIDPSPSLQQSVGWVERSDTHQRLCSWAMGFASLYPSYADMISRSRDMRRRLPTQTPYFEERQEPNNRTTVLRQNSNGASHGRTSEDHTPAQNCGPKEQPQDDCEEIIAEAMVAASHPGKRCTRSEARRLHADQREEDRGVAEAIRRTQFAPQIGRVSIGAVDADLLYQPRRKDLAEDAARKVRTREGRVEASVRERVVSMSSLPSAQLRTGRRDPRVSATRSSRYRVIHRGNAVANALR